MISGNLLDIAFPDLLQFLHMSGRSGTLYLERDGETAHISFHAGRIASAWCPNTITVVEYLHEAGRLDTEGLDRARAIHEAEPERRTLGEVLLSIAAIRPEELREAVIYKIEQTVYELVSWRRGDFRFVVEEVRYDEELLFAPEDIIPRVELDTQVVLMEALRLLDERVRDSRPLRAEAARAIAASEARAEPVPTQFRPAAAPASRDVIARDTIAGVRRLLREIRSGEDGSRMSVNLMAFVAQLADRAVLLSVRRDHLVALTAFGRAADRARLADATRGLRLVFETSGSIALCFDAGCAAPLDWDCDEIPQGLRMILGRPATGHGALFPMMSTRRKIAVLYADQGDKADAALDLDVLELATGQFGLAIENEILRRQLDR